MSVPVIELIAVDIEAAINAITVAAKFNQTLIAVRPKRSDFKDTAPLNGKVLIYQGGKEPFTESPGCSSWIQEFVLEAIVLDSDKTETSIDTRLNQVAADIEKKLRTDHTRDGNAIDTLLRGAEPFNDGQGMSGIDVFIGVQYRVKENDPYTRI